MTCSEDLGYEVSAHHLMLFLLVPAVTLICLKGHQHISTKKGLRPFLQPVTDKIQEAHCARLLPHHRCTVETIGAAYGLLIGA